MIQMLLLITKKFKYALYLGNMLNNVRIIFSILFVDKDFK